jgi:integrase
LALLAHQPAVAIKPLRQLTFELVPKRFLTATGIVFQSIYNSWDTARRTAKLPDVRVHDLRHSCASNLVNSGQSLYVVAKVLGHSQTRTTERYAHLDAGVLLKAVNGASEVTGTTWAADQA